MWVNKTQKYSFSLETSSNADTVRDEYVYIGQKTSKLYFSTILSMRGGIIGETFDKVSSIVYPVEEVVTQSSYYFNGRYLVASNTSLILNSNNQITLSTDSFSSNIILVKAGSTFDIRKNVDGWYIQRNPAEGIISTRYKAKKNSNKNKLYCY